ncbi:MAG: FAD-binding oxidoreductase [Spirochaetes bacterium]|nr:FAD-binding oxidoreductase [Spirochaetota bacterium]
MQTGIFRQDAHDGNMRIVEGWRRIAEDYPDYLRDESGMRGEGVEKLFFPGSTKELLWVVQKALREGVPVTVSGGRTGICGGAVPQGGWILSLERMKRVVGLKRGASGYELEVESGLRLSELAAMLRSRTPEFEGGAASSFSREAGRYFYPPDPTETTATIGGTVATNASGARTFRYGPTRGYVTGVTVVLPTGELLVVRRGEVYARDGSFTIPREGGPPLLIPSPRYGIPGTKHSAGLYSEPQMDLIDLFIGSEGILGVIATVTVRLVPEPHAYFSGVGFFPSETRALQFVVSARSGSKRPLALEYFDSASLMLLETTRGLQGSTSEIPEIPNGGRGVFAVYFESEITGEKKAPDTVRRYGALLQEAGCDPKAAWGALNARDLGRLKSFRHALPETVNAEIASLKKTDPSIHKVGTDMAVPDDRLFDMMAFYREALEKERIRHVVFGHIGNNHLHVNLIPSDRTQLSRAKELYEIFARRAVEWGGSVSAEHGIGKLKRQFLPVQFKGGEIEEMKTIKKLLDPAGVMNPGDVLT